MCTKSQLTEIIGIITEYSKEVFGNNFQSVILYGSYARRDYDEESDIDIMIMVDMDMEELAQFRKQMNSFSADLDLKYGVVLSFKLQSSSLFDRWKKTLPFYQNVEKDGVRYA